MPKGVDHGETASGPSGALRAKIFDAERRGSPASNERVGFTVDLVQKSLMPKGVDHPPVEAIQRWIVLVQKSLMPKGVDHLTNANVLTTGFECKNLGCRKALITQNPCIAWCGQ